MHRITSDIYELVIGALIFGLGLFYLTFQSYSTERLINVVENKVIENRDLYQQYSTADINLISNNELYAIIMGNRELPIVIDGDLIEVDGNDYDLYFSYVRNGYYIKSYVYDSTHKIIQVIYKFAGS